MEDVKFKFMMQDIWMMIKFGMLAFVVVFAIVYFVDKYKNQIRR